MDQRGYLRAILRGDVPITAAVEASSLLFLLVYVSFTPIPWSPVLFCPWPVCHGLAVLSCCLLFICAYLISIHFTTSHVEDYVFLLFVLACVTSTGWPLNRSCLSPAVSFCISIFPSNWWVRPHRDCREKAHTHHSEDPISNHRSSNTAWFCVLASTCVTDVAVAHGLSTPSPDQQRS